MKITNVKAMVAKVFTVGLVAAAIVVAAPTKAEAQISFGVRVGPPVAYGRPDYAGPVYAVPAYGYYGSGYYGRDYDRERREDFDRRRDWERREYFEHQRDFDRRDWNDRHDRDDRRDRDNHREFRGEDRDHERR